MIHCATSSSRSPGFIVQRRSLNKWTEKFIYFLIASHRARRWVKQPFKREKKINLNLNRRAINKMEIFHAKSRNASRTKLIFSHFDKSIGFDESVQTVNGDGERSVLSGESYLNSVWSHNNCEKAELLCLFFGRQTHHLTPARDHAIGSDFHTPGVGEK